MKLTGGISLIAAMIGFYAIPEVIKALAKSDEVLEVKNVKDDVKEKINEFKIALENIPTIIKSSLIGLGIGALPGVGEDVAAWVAYDSVKKGSKQKEKYGTGECYEAIIAPEVGNNAAIGGATIPLLTLAVPGSPPAAVLLGAFMIHNVRPGPMIMIDSPTFIFYIAALIFASTLCLWLVGTILARPMSSILKVPSRYLMPIITVLSIVGAYAITLNKFDVTIVFIFGAFGYILDKMKYSPAPIVLGIILGTMIDENFRRALIVNQGNFMPFINNSWISILFFTIIMIIIIKQIFPNIVLNPIKWVQTEKK
ncbi:MAG: tripartite tricarboxylate transporter permease [Brevinema sp.]